MADGAPDLAPPAPRRRYSRRQVVRGVVTASSLVYGGAALAWVGATSARVTWFGALTWHGPRSGNQVALTFDDGPNPPHSFDVADVLERYGARGTFFQVGRAVAQRPDVSRELLGRGHLLGNHSFTHGELTFLDPAYPELRQTNDAIRDATGVQPAFYRPPHGTHSPVLSHVVGDQGMTLTNWDDSANDWVETDSTRLAANILKKAQAGSIIDLHDGLDGKIGVDRSVVANALPAILEGLKSRGLEPVTLDTLLGKAGYLPG